MKKVILFCVVIVLALSLVSCGGGDKKNDDQTWRISYLNGDTLLVDGDCFFVESMEVGIRVVCNDTEGNKIFDGVVASYQPFR